MAGALMTVSFTLFFRHSIGMVYTDDAVVAAIAAQFLIYSAGWQLFGRDFHSDSGNSSRIERYTRILRPHGCRLLGRMLPNEHPSGQRDGSWRSFLLARP